jgi:cation:H+ antiporter
VGLEFVIIRDLVALPFTSYELLIAYTVVYLVLGTGMFIARRNSFQVLFGRLNATARTAFGNGDVEKPEPGD